MHHRSQYYHCLRPVCIFQDFDHSSKKSWQELLTIFLNLKIELILELQMFFHPLML